MWTPEARTEHDRDDLRYPNDLTDAEGRSWRLLPPPAGQFTYLANARTDQRDLLRAARRVVPVRVSKQSPDNVSLNNEFLFGSIGKSADRRTSQLRKSSRPCENSLATDTGTALAAIKSRYGAHHRS